MMIKSVFSQNYAHCLNCLINLFKTVAIYFHETNIGYINNVSNIQYKIDKNIHFVMIPLIYTLQDLAQ